MWNALIALSVLPDVLSRQLGTSVAAQTVTRTTSGVDTVDVGNPLLAILVWVAVLGGVGMMGAGVATDNTKLFNRGGVCLLVGIAGVVLIAA